MKISRILARTTGRRGLRRKAEGRRKGVEEETVEEKEREAISAEKTRENWFELALSRLTAR